MSTVKKKIEREVDVLDNNILNSINKLESVTSKGEYLTAIERKVNTWIRAYDSIYNRRVK